MSHHTGSFDGLHQTPIFTQAWLPDGDPRAAVLVAHGMGEHSGRYAHVAAHLNRHGYAVHALDHRGHGRSGGERMAIRDLDDYVTDLHTCFERVRADYPDLPVFLYGHSMGTLIALLFAFRFPGALAGLVMTGTELRLPSSNALTNALIKGAGRLLPEARLFALDPASLSHDPAVVQAYREDPLVYHGRIPMAMLAAMVSAAERCTALLPTLRLPLLALHGGADALTLVAGADIVREQCGAPDTTVKVYEGLYHEIHNEPEQAQVLENISGWLNAHLPH